MDRLLKTFVNEEKNNFSSAVRASFLLEFSTIFSFSTEKGQVNYLKRLKVKKVNLSSQKYMYICTSHEYYNYIIHIPFKITQDLST